MLKIVLYILCIISLSSCTRGGDITLWEEQNNPGNYQILDMKFLEETGQIVGVGGQPWDIGTLHISNDLGSTWKVDSISKFTLYSLAHLHNQQWIAVGLYGTIIRIAEDYSQKELIRFNDFNLSGVSCSKDEILITGYENFQEGVVQIFDYHLNKKKDTIITQGIFAGLIKNNTHYVGGYGIALMKESSSHRFDQINGIEGDQINHIFQDTNDNLYLLGHGGHIFVRTHSNQSWEAVKITKNFIRNPGFKTGLAVPVNGKLIVAGERGNLFTSLNGGKTWKKREAPDEDFNSMIYAPPYLVFSTKSGKIFRIAESEI